MLCGAEAERLIMVRIISTNAAAHLTPKTMLDSLNIRRREPELMDQPGLNAVQHRLALKGLARINWWSRSAAIFWPSLKRLAAGIQPAGKELRILDLACGGGDVTVALALHARQQRLPLKFVGADISSTALAVATERARLHQADVEFIELNILHEPLPAGFDAIICSLFLHHLDEDDAIGVLRKMAEATNQLVLVNDLIRSRAGYALAKFGSLLLTRSHIVHVDGPLSVAGAFSISEAQELANAAGLRGANFETHWPQRFLLSWSKS